MLKVCFSKAAVAGLLEIESTLRSSWVVTFG
jgi:hypothetical protein